MSSSIVDDAIAEELALLERVQDAPSAPFGYGSDLSCDTDLTERMDEVGASTLALGQALARRLDCPRGALLDDPDYGIDLRAHLNRGSTTRDLRTLATRIKAEIEKDDRVDTVAVQVTPATDGSSLAVELAVTPVDASVGDFGLTLAATSAGVIVDAIGGSAL